VPPAPSGLKATTGDGLVTLHWTAVEGADEYNVYRSTRSIEELPAEPTAGVSKPEFADESVKNGTTYYYRVTAVADEEGAPSEEVEVTPFAGPPRPDVTERATKRIRGER
jgi:fibronectin type 3 domain-containing protein